MYDLIIVGGGPGAWRAGPPDVSGPRALLLEKEVFPRRSPVAEPLGPGPRF